jgi:DNA-binding transcriptional LysR family regulator
MDLDRLRLFLAIVRSGSMTAAARAVHLTQPAVSRSVHLLEDAIGAPLFVRAGRSIVLTAAGRALVPRAEALLEGEARLRLEVQRSAERDYFDLRLGVIDSVASGLLPEVARPLLDAFPGLALKISTGRSAVLVARIAASELDLAVIASSGAPTLPPGAAADRLGRYDLQFFGRRDRFAALADARTEEDVRAFPLVEIEPPPGQEPKEPPDALSYARASNVASVRALVLAGFGVGDLPTFVVDRDDLRALVAARVPHDPDCALYLVRGPSWHYGRQDPIRADVARRLSRALAAREPAKPPVRKSGRRSTRNAPARRALPRSAAND